MDGLQPVQDQFVIKIPAGIYAQCLEQGRLGFSIFDQQAVGVPNRASQTLEGDRPKNFLANYSLASQRLVQPVDETLLFWLDRRPQRGG